MITLIFLILFIVVPFLCAAQLTPGQVLRVKPDGIHFELIKEYFTPDDTSHSNLKIMTRWVADSSITVINSAIASKLATVAFTAAAITALYGYTPANPDNFKGVADSGNCVGCYATGYDLKKSKDSVVALIPTNNNQLSNGAAYLVASDISGKKNITDSGRLGGQYFTGGSAKKVIDSLGSLFASYVATSRTISTTSPITGGGDLSSNRTIAINNAAADGSTKGAASFTTEYFDDNGSGIISLAFLNGTGTVSANAVTINATKGKITYTSPSISAGNAIGVTLTNSYISATSIITANINSNGTNFTTNIQCYVKSQTSGSCVVNIANLSLLSLFNTSFIIDFTVIN